MKTTIQCIPCLISQGIRVADYLNIDDEVNSRMVREILGFLHTSSFDKTPVHLAKEIYRIIYSHVNCNDPYKELKEYFNNEILKMEDKMLNLCKISENPFETALKLAISGNIIDFGTSHKITQDLIFDMIDKTEHKLITIDDSQKMYEILNNAKTLLYLGDNCGEIVFDKIFIKTIKNLFPKLDIIFAVRGGPIINDITTVDAEYIGLTKIVKVIDNGDAAPGTIIDNISADFKNIFYSADVVISKGQGNFESLNDINRTNLFFLFMAKCDPVATKLKVKKFDLLCMLH